MIEIVIANTGQRRTIPEGTTLLELAKQYSHAVFTQTGERMKPILGAMVNNQAQSLQYKVYRPKTIEFFTIDHRQGWRMYESSLCFMLYKAVLDCYPDATLCIEHSVSFGFFCSIRFKSEDSPSQEIVAKTVSKRMKELQEEDLPFESKTMLVDDAVELLKDRNLPKTVELIQSLKQLYVEMNFLGDTVHHFSTHLVPSTACLDTWEFTPYERGYQLFAPIQHQDFAVPNSTTPKLFNIFQEFYQWADLLNVSTINDLNRIIRDGNGVHLIHVAEALQEKRYAQVADDIAKHKDVRMVMLAGPSSSGKTTSCRRLSIQLNVLGYDVQQLSLDDYFVPRSRTPHLPNGELDFESIDALDIPLLNEHLLALFRGEEVKVPTFDFIKGDPYFSGKTMKLGPSSILLIEGIHGLNPKLTADIPTELKYGFYVSAMAQVSIDDQNIIHSSDNRLLRRIVRDNNFRGWNALETLSRWREVQMGEYKHIFPNIKYANSLFNSALIYELSILKTYAEPLLKQVPQTRPEYAEARRLLNFVELIEPMDSNFIPSNSIMREFLGNSSFKY